MSTLRATDRGLFMANRPPGTPIRVVRMPAAEIVRRNGRIVTMPAVKLTYSFQDGDQAWVFQEIRVAETNVAHIDLSGTLWAELEVLGDYQLLQRSGSF